MRQGWRPGSGSGSGQSPGQRQRKGQTRALAPWLSIVVKEQHPYWSRTGMEIRGAYGKAGAPQAMHRIIPRAILSKCKAPLTWGGERMTI